MSNSRLIIRAAVVAIPMMLPVTAHAREVLPALPTMSQTLTLKDALTLAAGNNLAIKQASADAGIAGATARSADAQTKPSIATTSYGLVGDSNNIVSASPGVMPQNTIGVPSRGFLDQNIMLMLPLFTGGKISGQVGAASAQSRAAAFTLDAARLTTQDAVTTTYTKALLQRALVEVAQARLTAEDEQVRVTQENVDTGHSAPVNLLREQAEEANARQGLLAAQSDEAIALVQLKTAVGVSQASDITLTDTLDTVAISPALPASLQDALQTAEANRPDLAAALKQIDAARQSVRAVQGTYSPQVYALGMADASSVSNGPGRVGYTVGLTASIPLYDGGQRRADADAADAQLDRATLDAESIRQTVDQDVATAWINLHAAVQQIQTARTGVNAAQQAYDLANLRFNAGKSVAVERLDALAALTRARGDFSAATATVIETRAHLLTTIGSSL